MAPETMAIPNPYRCDELAQAPNGRLDGRAALGGRSPLAEPGRGRRRIEGIVAADGFGRTASAASQGTGGDLPGEELLALVAHELRNALAPLPLRTTLARQSRDRATILRSLDIIDRQVALMAVLVDDLVDYSRSSVGNYAVREELTCLQTLAETAYECNLPLVESAGQRFILICGKERVLVRVDPRRMQQILGNLIGNAVKFTPNGGTLKLTVGSDGEAGILRLADTGIGMTRVTLARAFDMFTQGCEAHARSPDGLGIGLAVARRLVELQGGTLHAESNGPHQGSVLTVSLPLAA